jgi:hypothetical protein
MIYSTSHKTRLHATFHARLETRFRDGVRTYLQNAWLLLHTRPQYHITYTIESITAKHSWIWITTNQF